VLSGDVGPELPESRWPVLLPAMAALGFGLVLLRRRHRGVRA
jgi:hypothetical protein